MRGAINLSADAFIEVVRTILTNAPTMRGGMEKGVIFSDASPYALLLYNLSMIPQEQADLLPNRMDSFQRLGDGFSVDCYPDEDDLSCITEALAAITDGMENSDLAANIHRVAIEDPQTKERPALIALQHNLTRPEHGSFVTLSDLFKASPPFELTPERRNQLILSILSRYALSEAIGRVIWDTKLDNIMGNTGGDVVLIDLGPSSYRLKTTFCQEFAAVDGRHWEKLRVAHIISQLTGEPSTLESLHYKRLLTWGEERLAHMSQYGIQTASDRMISALFVNTPYPDVIRAWINHVSRQADAADLLHTLNQQLTTVTSQIARLPRIRRQSSIAGLALFSDVGLAPQASQLASKWLTEVKTDNYQAVNQRLATVLSQGQAILRDLRDDKLRKQLNQILAPIAQELMTLSTLSLDRATACTQDDDILTSLITDYSSFVTKLVRPFLAEASRYADRLPNYSASATDTASDDAAICIRELADFNRACAAFEKREKRRCGAIVGSVLCALVGAGGAASASYCLLSGQSPLTFGILLAASCVLLLLTAFPAVVAEQGRLGAFAKTSRIKQATKVIKANQRLIELLAM